MEADSEKQGNSGTDRIQDLSGLIKCGKNHKSIMGIRISPLSALKWWQEVRSNPAPTGLAEVILVTQSLVKDPEQKQMTNEIPDHDIRKQMYCMTNVNR